jgi:hypothetical protein
LASDWWKLSNDSAFIVYPVFVNDIVFVHVSARYVNDIVFLHVGLVFVNEIVFFAVGFVFELASHI